MLKKEKKVSQPSSFLSFEQEQELFRLFQEEGNKTAQSRILEAYRPLVGRIVSDVWKRTPQRASLSYEDLEQEGFLGLVIAMEKFEPKLENRFGGYAPNWIYGRVSKYVIEHWSIVRIGARLFRRMYDLNKQEIEILKSKGFDTSTIEINSAHLSATESQIVATLKQRDDSLSAEAYSEETGGTAKVDLLVDETQNTEDTVSTKLDFEKIRAILEGGLLTNREKMVIQKRFIDEDKVGLRELGDEVGLTYERVRQIQKEALLKLKEALFSECD